MTMMIMIHDYHNYRNDFNDYEEGYDGRDDDSQIYLWCWNSSWPFFNEHCQYDADDDASDDDGDDDDDANDDDEEDDDLVTEGEPIPNGRTLLLTNASHQWNCAIAMQCTMLLQYTRMHNTTPHRTEVYCFYWITTSFHTKCCNPLHSNVIIGDWG